MGKSTFPKSTFPVPQRLAQAQAVLVRMLTWEAPADVVLSRWLRGQPGLGARDRAQVADAVFDVLRHLRRYQHYCEQYGGQYCEQHAAKDTPRTDDSLPIRRLALLGLAATRPGQMVSAALTAQDTHWLQRVQQINMADLPPALRHSVPDWLLQRLQDRLPTLELHALLAALNQPAPLDVRINPLKKTSRDAMLAVLRERFPDSHPQPTPYSPWGIRLHGRPNIQREAAFLKGELEVQDEASQLVALLLAPKRGEVVIDWCAGAGGKTLLLGAMMHNPVRNTGRLYALDTSAARLARAQARLARGGLDNVVVMAIEPDTDLDTEAASVRRLHGKAHRVLVDAPCSGLGTLRRSPDLKWRQNAQTLAQLCQTQAKIMDDAAACVAPGGRLVYATCSMLEEENEAQVEAFLRTHPEFSLQHVGEILQKRWGIEIEPISRNPASPFLNLRPHLHQTDGFFAAVLQRSTTAKTAK